MENENGCKRKVGTRERIRKVQKQSEKVGDNSVHRRNESIKQLKEMGCEKTKRVESSGCPVVMFSYHCSTLIPSRPTPCTNGFFRDNDNF